MACSQYRKFITKFSQFQTRNINLQSCNFARGNRFVPFTKPAGIDNFTEQTDPDCRVDAFSPKVKDVKSSSPSDHEVISLDEDEVKKGDKSQIRTAHHEVCILARKPSVSEHVFSSSSLPYYNKLGDSDTKFSSLMLLMKSRKERERRRQILLEGQRLIQDALDAGVKPQSIFFSRKESLEALKIPDNTSAEIFKLQYKQLQLWSNLTTSPGIIGVFETPSKGEVQSLSGAEGALPLTLVCDNVREPGNLGAILRVAAGVGCLQVLLTKGCVDLWEPKVLRSGAGAHFRVPVHQGVRWDNLEQLVNLEKASVYLADSSAREGEGQKVPSRDYAEVDFGSEPGAWVLVLGGETQGLSAEAHSLALLAPSQCRLHIPLSGGVDSLNAAAALAVLMFEMRRQRGITQGNSLASLATLQ